MGAADYYYGVVKKLCCKQFSNPRNSSKIVVVGHRGGLKTEKSEESLNSS